MANDSSAKFSQQDQATSDSMVRLFIGALALVVLPIVVVALPAALFLKALLEEEHGEYKFCYGLFVVASFYIFLLGFHNGIYEGFCFTAINDSMYGLFSDLMSLKPSGLNFYPQYPYHVRNYFYFSLPLSIIMALFFKFRSKKSVRKINFNKKTTGVFYIFLRVVRILSFPFEAAFHLGLIFGGRLFSTKTRVLIFAFLSLTLSYTLVYLFLGPLNSWHIHFGYVLNKMSPGLFELLNPTAVNIFKSLLYYVGFLYPTYLAITFRDIEVTTIAENKRSKEQGPSSVLLGNDNNGKKFYLTNQVLNHHVHVVGASGFGKTVLLKNIIKTKIEAGEGLIFTDLKGDIDTIREIISYTIEAGRTSDFELFSISEDFLSISSNLSLFEHGNSLEIKDKIMGAFRPEHDYYKKRMKSFLTVTLRGLVWLRDQKGISFDFNTIYKLIGQFEEIESLVTQIDDVEIKSDIEKLILDKKLKEDLTGLRADIESLIKTDFGPLLVLGP